MENQKSPLDLITEIHAFLSRLDIRMAALDTRLAILEQKIAPMPVQMSAVRPTITEITSEPRPPAAVPKPGPRIELSDDEFSAKALTPDNAKAKSPDRISSIKVFGRMKDPTSKPMIGVSISVTDNTGKIIKTTKTNAIGDWVCFVPPGNYAVEFTKPGMRPQFKPIKLLPGQGELEVV